MKKELSRKAVQSFSVKRRIPKDNFYRWLKEVLDLDYLYPLTKRYYGSTGQKSIDPAVFFKLCLVGYLENLILGRAVYSIGGLLFSVNIFYFL